MIWPGFCSASYKLENPAVDPSETINYYLEPLELGPRAGQLRLRQIPGLRKLLTLPTAPVRGLWAGGNRLFAVGGGRLYEVYQDGTHSPSLGNVGNGTNPVTISSNGFQLFITSAGLGYVTNGPLVVIPGHPSDQSVVPVVDTQGQPLQAATGAFIDQYFIAAIQNSKQVRISNLAPAGAVWDPGDAAIKEAYSDNIQRVWVDQPGGELVFLFGAETMEIWQDQAGLFPFQRVSGAVFPIGTDSAWSVAGLRGMRFWLWQGTVWGSIGTSFPQRVSDFGIEQIIKGYSTFEQQNAESGCYVDGGHTFYTLSFSDLTLAYDASVKSWHKRLYWNNNQWNRYRPRLFAECWNMNLAGDFATGDIYVLDPKVYTDAQGVPLRRDRIAPYITDQNRNMRYNRLTLDLVTGVGLPVAQNIPGWDPQIGMRYSNNRGNTWSNWRNNSLGKMGEYERRVFWTQMGSSRIGMTIHTSVTEPVDASINGAYVDLGTGSMAART